MIQPISFNTSHSTFKAKAKVPFSGFYDPTCPHITGDILESMKNHKTPTEKLLEKITAPIKKLTDHELPDPNNIAGPEGIVSHILPSGSTIDVMMGTAADSSERFQNLLQTKELLAGHDFQAVTENADSMGNALGEVIEKVGNTLEVLS